MLILIATLLALVPAIAVLYPIVRGAGPMSSRRDGGDRPELERRWTEAVAALESFELERTLGNVDEDDYAWLRERYMTEAAVALKAIEELDREPSPGSRPNGRDDPETSGFAQDR